MKKLFSKRVFAVTLMVFIVGVLGYGMMDGRKKSILLTAQTPPILAEKAVPTESPVSESPVSTPPASETSASETSAPPALETTLEPPASLMESPSAPARTSVVEEEYSYTPGSSSLFGTNPSQDGTSSAGSTGVVTSFGGGDDNGYIALIEDIEVPSEEAGVLTNFNVQEGSSVKKGDEMAKIDDEQVRMAVRVADAKLKSAKRQAENDVNVRYAEAATKVAHAEILQADEANQRTPNTVTQAEYRRLLLAHKQAMLQIEQASHEFAVAKISVDVQQAELEAAELGVRKRSISAPVDGTVVEKYRHAGEWVKPGDPLVRLIRMDTVRVKFLLDAKNVSMSSVHGRTVEVTVPILPGKTFTGQVTFISPIIESGTRYQVWAEIPNQQENGYWLLQPGMQANAVVKP